MERIGKLGSAKRFGARYGSKTKHKFAKIEKEQRKRYKCPYCSAMKVKRVAVGIWQCRRCDSRFTGKAYSVSTGISLEKGPEIDEKVAIEAMEENAEQKEAE